MDSDTLRRDLENALVRLRPNQLRRFCFRLLWRTEGPSPSFRTRMDLDSKMIADLLVSTFTEYEALAFAVETLADIGCRNESHRLRLVMEARGHQPQIVFHSAAPFVDHQLIFSVDDVEPILDELLTEGAIQRESYDEISVLPTPEEKMRELLYKHLKAVGSRDILYNIVEKHRPRFYSASGVQHFGDMMFQSALSWEWFSDTNSELVSDTNSSESMMETKPDWIQLEPEVNFVDAEDPPIYSLQSEAGNFECSVSGLRWVCKEKVSIKYQFISWWEHMERLEFMHYIPGGPLMDVTIVAGRLDEAYLPHWICTENNPTILSKFAVLHIESYGDVLEPVSEVTPSHVKLPQPAFSPRGVLMKAGFPVKVNCKVLIYKTDKSFLTLHLYLIPPDPALQQSIKNKESSTGFKMIQKPYPAKSLKMRDRFILTADLSAVEICPQNLKLRYDGYDPNYYEVFIRNPDSNFQLTLTHESGPVWTCTIRKNDYQRTGDIQMMYEEELARVRPGLVGKMSRELINQLLDNLLADGVLSEGEKDCIIQENNTSADRARCLIDTVKKKGREAIRKIFAHLQSRDPMLFAQLVLPYDPPV